MASRTRSAGTSTRSKPRLDYKDTLRKKKTTDGSTDGVKKAKPATSTSTPKATTGRRGRPPAASKTATATAAKATKSAKKTATAAVAGAKKRGRPPKAAESADEAVKGKRGRKPAAATATASATPAKRGRKPKVETTAATTTSKRGRKPAATTSANKVVRKTATPKRGRPAGTATTPAKRGRKPAGTAEPAKRGRKPAAASATAEPAKRGRKPAGTAEPAKRGRKPAAATPVKSEKAPSKRTPTAKVEKKTPKSEPPKTKTPRARATKEKEAPNTAPPATTAPEESMDVDPVAETPVPKAGPSKAKSPALQPPSSQRSSSRVSTGAADTPSFSTKRKADEPAEPEVKPSPNPTPRGVRAKTPGNTSARSSMAPPSNKRARTAEPSSQPPNGAPSSRPTSSRRTPQPGAPTAPSPENKTTPILERGVAYFLTRPKTTLEGAAPHSMDDMQRSYMVLKPIPSKATTLANASASLNTKNDNNHLRLIEIPKKRFVPPGGRLLTWVAKSSATTQEIKDALGSTTYTTKTMGERTTPRAEVIGTAVYAITHTEESNRNTGTAHFAYVTVRPNEMGLTPVQREFGIQPRGSFVVNVRNPAYPGPNGIGNLGGEAKYSNELKNAFGTRRWHSATVPYWNTDNAQILFIGEKGAVEPAIDEIVGLAEEDEERLEELGGGKFDDGVFRDLELNKGEWEESSMLTEW